MNLRVSKIIALGLVLAGLAAGQSPVPTIPLSQQGKIFNAVTTAQTSGCLANQGQNIWLSTYVVNGGLATVQYRLEYSFNSDPATCTTGTWLQMSDDATDSTQGQVVGIGPYPFVRANLVFYSASGPTLTAFYTTSSASPSIPNGFYNPSQQVRKIVFANLSAAANSPQSVVVPTPFGTSQGILIVVPSGATFSGSSSISIGSLGAGGSNFNLPTANLAGSSNQAFILPATPSTSLNLAYSHGTTAAGTFYAYLVFPSPGSAVPSGQPPQTKNTESTSGANAAVSVTFTPPADQSAFIYSVNARCSAGTAQLTIVDQTASNTQIWSTAATEVGTTSFVRTWNAGLDASINVGDVVIVQLGACGPANTGTLDVQASIF